MKFEKETRKKRQENIRQKIYRKRGKKRKRIEKKKES